MKYIQESFINRLNLELIENKGDKYNFRCPICGDSKKSAYKKRGWLKYYRDKDTYIYHCFNCEATMGFSTFLREYYPSLYSEYKSSTKENIIESFTKESLIHNEFKKKEDINPLNLTIVNLPKNLIKIQELEQSPIIDYLESRSTPSKLYNNWYTNKNQTYVLVPFLYKNILYGYQLRDIRYKRFYIELPEGNPKIWNYLPELGLNENLYITESIFDSAVFYNSNLISSALIGKTIPKKIYSYILKLQSRVVFCLDNDKDGKQMIKKYIQLFPKAKYFDWKNLPVKDINELYIYCKNNNLDFKTIIQENISNNYDSILHNIDIDFKSKETKEVKEKKIDKIKSYDDMLKELL